MLRDWPRNRRLLDSVGYHALCACVYLCVCVCVVYVPSCRTAVAPLPQTQRTSARPGYMLPIEWFAAIIT